MSKTARILERLSVAIGLAFIIAGIGDYTSHMWRTVESPHPVWAPLVFIALGFLLLFPDRLREGVGFARELLPWWKPPEHNRRHDDPPGGEP